MKVEYIGSYDAILLPEVGRVVARGEVVDLPADTAAQAAYVQGLLDQGKAQARDSAGALVFDESGLGVLTGEGTEWRAVIGKRPAPSGE